MRCLLHEDLLRPGDLLPGFADEPLLPIRSLQLALSDDDSRGLLLGAGTARLGGGHHHPPQQGLQLGIGALGYTIQRPTEDRYLMTREELENKMAVLLGGRAAEPLVFDHL